MLIAIARKSATFCRWSLSKSAWIVDEEYFKSAVLGWCVELVRLSVLL